MVLAQSVVLAAHPKAKPDATATATSATSTPATTTSQPATMAAANDPADPPNVEIQKNIALWFCAAGTSAMVLFLARGAVVNGIAGFGMPLAGVPMGIAVGLLAAFMLAPWMQVTSLLNDLLSNLVHSGPAPIHPVLELAGESNSTLLRVTLFVTAVVFAPFVEEILFRGLLQTGLLKSLRSLQRYLQAGRPHTASRKDASSAPAKPAIPLDPPIVRIEFLFRLIAILTASAFFTIVHYPEVGWQGMAPLMALALALGYTYERTGQLWPCIMLHATFNAVSFASFLSQ